MLKKRMFRVDEEDLSEIRTSKGTMIKTTGFYQSLKIAQDTCQRKVIPKINWKKKKTSWSSQDLGYVMFYIELEKVIIDGKDTYTKFTI